MPKIIVKKGDIQVDQYIVEGGTIRIGRTPDNQIVLNDPSVSRSHAEVKIDPDSRRITIVDLNSSNGTYVNGIRISRIISSKATIGIGVYQLEVGQHDKNEEPQPIAHSEDVEATVMFAPGLGAGASSGSGRAAVPTQEQPNPNQGLMGGAQRPPAEPSKKRGWLRRLFGK